jgi:hypothetical protein
MDATLLSRFFTPGTWQGPCTVILDCDAAVQTMGSDAIANAGLKVFAPRVASGRVSADAVCLMPDHGVIFLVSQTKTRSQTGEDQLRQTLMVADMNHIAAIEFADVSALNAVGLNPPTIRMGFTSPIS